MQPLDHNQQVPQGGWGSVGREQRAASPGRAQRLQPLCVAAVNTRVFRGSQSLQAPKPHLPHPGRGGLSCAKAVPGLCYPPCTSAISSALQGDKDFFILFYFGDENCQTDSSVTRTVSFLPSLCSRPNLFPSLLHFPVVLLQKQHFVPASFPLPKHRASRVNCS